MGAYTEIVAEVFWDHKRGRPGVRPADNSKFPQSMKIECSKTIRNYPLGTKLKILVTPKHTDNTPHLYSSYRWAHKVVIN